jgi:hypothetical protein
MSTPGIFECKWPSFVNYPQKECEAELKACEMCRKEPPPTPAKTIAQGGRKMNLGEPNLSSPKIRYNCKNYQFFHKILVRIPS